MKLPHSCHDLFINPPCRTAPQNLSRICHEKLLEKGPLYSLRGDIYQNIVTAINLKLKQSSNESIKQIFVETQTVLSLKQPPNLRRLLCKKTDGYRKVFLIVITKTVSYVHYISDHSPVSRLQITLFGIT